MNIADLMVLSLYRLERNRERYIDDGTFMFSKVTGYIAFKRCPSLAVTLYIPDDVVEGEFSEIFASEL